MAVRRNDDPMKLNVIIATYDRAAILPGALRSLSEARPARGLDVTVTVVDNNSADATRQTVEDFQRKSALDVRYLLEPRQGKSCALNAGVAQADADLVGFIDDDIEVAPDWFEEIARVFAGRWQEVDFLGGKVLPLWESSPPPWLPGEMPGVLALQDCGDEELNYGDSFDGVLPGCQAVIKLSTLREVGPFNEAMGPVGKSLMGSEDDEMYYRLLDAGKRGIYSPRLVARHRVPAYRLTKRYFRQWCYSWGVSQSLIDSGHPTFYKGPRILGVPRYMYPDTVRRACKMLPALVKGDVEGCFANELSLWIMAGFFCGRNSGNAYIDWLARSIFGNVGRGVAR